MAKKVQKTIARSMIAAMAVAQVVPTYAGTWSQPSAGSWQYTDDSGNVARGTWIKGEGGEQYYIGEDGIMAVGWQQIGGARYFLNPMHDGHYGAVTTGGWKWIDGYCYYFDNDGRMASNAQTPDGYSVDAEGRWVENGTVVYSAGKGVPSSGDGAGSADDSVTVPQGSFVHGEGENAGKEWFRKADGSYPSNGWCWIDRNGDGIAECYYFDSNGWLVTNGITPDGYTVDASGAWAVNGMVQMKKASQSGGVSPSGGAPGVSTGAVSFGGTAFGGSGGGGGSSGGGGGGGGGSSSGGSSYSNRQTTQKASYSYKVEYIDEEGNVLAEISGTAARDSVINIEKKSFDGYVLIGNIGTKAVTEDGQIFVIKYKKAEIDQSNKKESDEQDETQDSGKNDKPGNTDKNTDNEDSADNVSDISDTNNDSDIDSDTIKDTDDKDKNAKDTGNADDKAQKSGDTGNASGSSSSSNNGADKVSSGKSDKETNKTSSEETIDNTGNESNTKESDSGNSSAVNNPGSVTDGGKTEDGNKSSENHEDVKTDSEGGKESEDEGKEESDNSGDSNEQENKVQEQAENPGKAGADDEADGEVNKINNESDNKINNETENKNNSEAEDKTDDEADEDEETTYSYKIIYLDQDDNVLKEIEDTASKNSSVDISVKQIDGYTSDAGNNYSFTLSEDGMEVILHYTKEKASYGYTIEYVDSDDGSVLATVSGTAKEGQEVTIPDKAFDGYEKEDNQPETIEISEGASVSIRYKKTESDTGSGTGIAGEAYTIRYINKDTEAVVLEESGTAEAGNEITPITQLKGYDYASEYSFEVGEDGNNDFAVYLVGNNTDDEEIVETKYTIRCVDEDGITLKTYTGTVMCGDEPVEITRALAVDDYTRIDSERFFAQKYKANSFEAVFKKNARTYTFTVTMTDIDTGVSIGMRTYTGYAGDTVNFGGLTCAGYDLVDNQDSSARISTNPSNNSVKLYFRKKDTTPAQVKTAYYTIRFVNKSDHSQDVLDKDDGYAEIGELEYCFEKTFNDKDGNVWEAVNRSPMTFTVTDKGMNDFLIEYVYKGNVAKEKQDVSYAIRYVAEDTGGVLGVTSGVGKEGDQVTLRNTWTPDYTFGDAILASSVVLDAGIDGEFLFDVPMRRVTTREHDSDDFTNKYKGREWSAIYIDSAGNYLMPAVTGFSVEGDMFYMEYPAYIEEDGTTYRAKIEGPLIEVVAGTETKHYVIRYITGSPSEDKLAEWEARAHQAADAVFGTEPAKYFVTYRERNLDNDIGMEFGVGCIGDEVEINNRDFIGWSEPTTRLGGFKLDSDGKQAYAQYDFDAYVNSDGKYIGQSLTNISRRYTVHIEDEDGNNLAEPQVGHMWFESDKVQRPFTVYFPEMFTDADGVTWTSVEESPKTALFDTLSDTDITIKYHKLADRNGLEYVVENNNDVNRILNNFVTRMKDKDDHTVYLIGKNYNPLLSEISATSLNSRMGNCGAEIADVFTIGEDDFTVVRFTISRYWDQDRCTHDWHYDEQAPGSCSSNGRTVAVCSRCGKTITVNKAATGHIDENCDSVCDVCGTQLKRQLGDEVVVTWFAGEEADRVGFNSRDYHFICIDENYHGTGKLLYICEESIGSDVYGTYAKFGNALYSDSLLKGFLGDEFSDGLSVKNNLGLIDGQRVSLLPANEFNAYRAAMENNYPFPYDTTITSTSTEAAVTLTDGTTVSAQDASLCDIHPVFLMDKSDEEEGKSNDIWNIGDLQLRKIAGKEYLFRCVDTNYKDADKASTDKAQALFLCETVIPANELLGFDGAGDTQLTRFFGSNNNYRYSTIKKFLEDNTSINGSMSKVDIGIINEYSGETGIKQYENFSASSLRPHRRSSAQKLYARIFIPSIEEAMAMKDYLWKFNGSEKNNALDIVTPYCRAYWLRTPEYGTSNMIYSVNLETGKIEPRPVSATADNSYSITGIRPMYAVEQDRESSATSGR